MTTTTTSHQAAFTPFIQPHTQQWLDELSPLPAPTALRCMSSHPLIRAKSCATSRQAFPLSRNPRRSTTASSPAGRPARSASASSSRPARPACFRWSSIPTAAAGSSATNHPRAARRRACQRRPDRRRPHPGRAGRRQRRRQHERGAEADGQTTRPPQSRRKCCSTPLSTPISIPAPTGATRTAPG